MHPISTPDLGRPPSSLAGPAPAPAMDAVAAYLRRLGQTTASRSLRRQRAWALREAVLFAAARSVCDVTTGQALTPRWRSEAEARVPGVALVELLDERFLDEWLTYADPVLRGTSRAAGATQRARTASLRALSGFTGGRMPEHRHGKPVLRELLTPPEIAAALRALTLRLPGRGPDDHVRLAAILAVTAAWPARSQELSRLRRDGVHHRGSQVLLDVGEQQPVTLDGVAAERLLDWLAVRDGLVAALAGGPVRALWTSIRSNSRPGVRGSVPLPAGMPLQPRGLQRAYARSVEAANVVHAGVPGFPLPRSLDLLRRSLSAAHPHVPRDQGIRDEDRIRGDNRLGPPLPGVRRPGPEPSRTSP